MKTAVRYGIFVGLASFLWIMAEYWLGFRTTDFGTHLITSLFSIIILIAGILVALYAQKASQKGKYTFSNGFLTGIGVAFIAGLIMVAGQYLYIGVIDTDYPERAKSWSTYVQVLDGVPPEEARANTAYGAWKHNIHSIAWRQVPLFLVQGAIISIGASALVMRKK